MFPPETTKEKLAVPIAATNIEDSQIWPFTTDGEYTVKIGYKVLFDDRSSSLPSSSVNNEDYKPLWKAIWSAKAPPKIKNFI